MKKCYFLALLFLWAGTGFAQVVTETFTNLPATPINSYFAVNWTGDNGLPWTATDSRIDQVVNTGNKAIGLRNGTISCANIPNGVDSIAFTYKYLFTSGGTGTLTVKVNGVSVGTLSVPQTQTTPATAIFKNFSYTGNFLLEIVESVSGPRIAIDDISWRNVANTPCTTPTAQPTAITFSSVTTNAINVAFTAASPAPNQYLAVISTSPTLGAVPVNGTTYSVDDPFGTGVVEYIGSGTSFSSTGLAAGTTYYYTIFAANNACSGGPLYKINDSATGNQATVAPVVCTTPTGQVSAVNFTTISSSTLGGSFTATPDADSYLICYTTSGTLGFTPVNGTTYTVGQTVGNGKVTKAGAGTTFSQAGLTANTAYNFFFFSYNGAGCTGGPLYNSTAFPAMASTNNSSVIPANYYNAIVPTDTCSKMKTALYNLVKTMTPKSYGDLLTQYQISDIKPGEASVNALTGVPYNFTGQNVLWDIYSDIPGPNNDPYEYNPAGDACGSIEGDGWNREHSVPQSWFTGGTANGPGTDYFHIYPTDCKVNGNRSNYIYGEVSSPTTISKNGSKLGPNAFAGLSGTAFEPIDEYKGDLARAFFYFVTRYQPNMPSWPPSGSEGSQAMQSDTFPSIKIPYLKLMLKWHNQDPVSTKEIERNKGGYTFQGNANPFVDHPEWVGMTWNPICYQLSSALPVDIISFKGTLKGAAINLEWEVMNEQKLAQYEIERSTNGKDFTKIGSTKATNAGTYFYTDDVSQLSGRRLYYRLKKVDVDGKHTYSDVFSQHIPLNLQFSIYPNPVVEGYVKVAFAKPAVRNAVIHLVDMAGKIQQQIAVNTGTVNMTINLKNVPAGMYLLKLVLEGNAVVQKIQVL